jgi:hypothetical protein
VSHPYLLWVSCGPAMVEIWPVQLTRWRRTSPTISSSSCRSRMCVASSPSFSLDLHTDHPLLLLSHADFACSLRPRRRNPEGEKIRRKRHSSLSPLFSGLVFRSCGVAIVSLRPLFSGCGMSCHICWRQFNTIRYKQKVLQSRGPLLIHN